MIALFDAWCAFSPRTRIVCWVSWVAALSTMKAPWEAMVSLFGYLAARGMSVSAFSLKAENDERVLTLMLESLHEG